MDRFLALRVFCKVADSGSFSRAARELSMTQSAASRGIADLESRLGLRLFERTTRRVALTLEGRAYYEQIEEHVRALEDAELRAASGFGDLAGRVKLSAPGALGRRLLLPELVRIMHESPGLVVDAALTDQRVDLVAGAFDFALRVGVRSEPSFIERTLGTSPQWLVGSAGLFAGKPAPTSMSELAAERVVASGGVRDLEKMGLTVRLTTDDIETNLRAVEAGLGVSVLPRWLVARRVQEGRLIRLLPRLPLPSPPLVVVYPRRLRRVARQVLERLERHLQKELTSDG
ncbi:LysR family transcriptional regulator [Sorangium sp. So ce117]|uniref:LysR family transcriptional regulator n=1 Tax=Sorangium sp. So ce117 TaxID=3133277 RepID=UPI003F63A51E